MNMLIKEECEKALENLRILERKDNFKKWGGQVSPQINCDVVEQLIKEHFELVELLKPHGYGMLSADEFERWINFICKHNADNDMIIMSQNEQLESIKNPQPYKFEELKKGMWVWDDKGLYCFECNPAISKNGTRCVTYNAFWYNCGEDEDEFFEEYDEFEEGRFFPIMKAYYYNQQRR